MKHLLGEASPEEEQAVIEWMNENATHKEYYEQLRKIWDTSKDLAAGSTVDVNKAWAKFQRRIGGHDESPKVIKSNRFSWMKVAASVILIAGLGFAAFLLINNNIGPKDVVAQTNQNVLIDTLSDGSVVTLNKRSTITYPSKFKGKTRAIALKGEAFFNVAPDKKKTIYYFCK